MGVASGCVHYIIIIMTAACRKKLNHALLGQLKLKLLGQLKLKLLGQLKLKLLGQLNLYNRLIFGVLQQI